MQRINSEKLGLFGLWQKIKNQDEKEIEIVVDPLCPLLGNRLSFEFLINQASQINKRLSFIFADDLVDRPIGPDSVPVLVETEARPGDVSPPAASFGPGILFRRLVVKSVWWRIALLLLLILAAPFFWVHFFSTTKIRLELTAEPLVETLEIEGSPSASASALPLSRLEVRQEQSQSSGSSGQKEIGEKATGTVTIYNKTLSLATFPAGTIISKGRISGEDLRFLTKAGTSLPARTADVTATVGYVPGRINVDVVAERLGEEYNLSPGGTFIVGAKATNEIIGENAADFSGGTRRQVAIVTIADHKGLLDLLTEVLKERLKGEIFSAVPEGQSLEENSLEYEVTKKSYDKAIGEEAQELNLTLALTGRVRSFRQEDLRRLVAKRLQDLVPNGYDLFGNDLTMEVLTSQKRGDELLLSVRTKGFIVRKVDVEKVRRDLRGKSLAAAERYLQSLPSIISFGIENPLKLGPWQMVTPRAEGLIIEVRRR